MSTPIVVRDPTELQRRCEEARRAGRMIGLVPTMGALHEGHLSLMRAAREEGANFVVVTIFVNPLQFGAGEDLDRYPRTFEADLGHCANEGVDLVFAPSEGAMYPEGFQTLVRVEELTQQLEGVHRPEHFDGVTTVVAKLFILVGACKAIFGRKDYQQWRVIERMNQDLGLPIEVIGQPTVRESDGLALSSRNRYLDAAQRERALGIATGLRAAHDAWQGGERSPERLLELARAPIEARFDAIDYIAVVHPRTLTPIETSADGALLLVAAHLGKTRLIDNLNLALDTRP